MKILTRSVVQSLGVGAFVNEISKDLKVSIGATRRRSNSRMKGTERPGPSWSLGAWYVLFIP